MIAAARKIFRKQLIALTEMVQHGDLDPATNTGAWAGEIGQVQMLPDDIIHYGVDGDGDGHINVKTSSADAVLTAAAFIKGMGFKPGEPWLQEVELPENLALGKIRPRQRDPRVRLVRPRCEAARWRHQVWQSAGSTHSAAGP